MAINRKYITLVVTHQCNIRCSYCYEKHKDSKTMSFENAIRIIEFELNKDDSYDDVEICFLGGEPLLEFDLIKRVVEYTKIRKYKKNYYFFVSTNGTVINDDMKEWFKKNTNILQMGLSLDGTPDVHNLNRCHSYDLIPIDFFLSTYPEQGIKMTVAPNTLDKLSESVIYCHNLGFTEISCNLAYGIDWRDIINKEILIRECNKLVEYYLQNPHIKPCSLLDIDLLSNISQSEGKIMKVCGSGRGTKAFDFDGTVYPCQFFLPLSIGEEKAKLSLKLDMTKDEILACEADPMCKNCCLKNICSTCYGSNFSSTGNIYKHDENMCELMKCQYYFTAYFAIKLFEKKIINRDDNLAASILKSALIIFENIKI